MEQTRRGTPRPGSGASRTASLAQPPQEKHRGGTISSRRPRTCGHALPGGRATRTGTLGTASADGVPPEEERPALKHWAGDRRPLCTPALRAVSGSVPENSGDVRTHSSLLTSAARGPRLEPALRAQPRPAEPRATPRLPARERSAGRRGRCGASRRAGQGTSRATARTRLGARLCPASHRSRSSHVEPKPGPRALRHGLDSRASELGKNMLPAARGQEGYGRHVHRSCKCQDSQTRPRGEEEQAAVWATATGPSPLGS